MVSLLVFLTYGIKQTMSYDGRLYFIVIREILAGVLLGFVAYLFFTVVQTAGAFIDLQMGFGMANVIDPMSGASSSNDGQFEIHDRYVNCFCQLTVIIIY